jgi:DNA topoisomerase I
MSKRKKQSTTLIIVESPAKCKKIEEYLGEGYKCVATYGHLRELPSLTHIDIANGFAPTYTVIQHPNKQKQIELLRKEIEAAAEVILASDGDREGEKIAYCVAQLFDLDIHNTKRIVFHEITEPAIRYAMAHPRTIDLNIVYAQQTRQILDVLVGFKISPVLWKLISPSKSKDNPLSAGRCQTPALKLVYEHQQKINKSVSMKLYTIVGYFTNRNIPFELHGSSLEKKEDVREFMSASMQHSHVYSCSAPGSVEKKPPEPFTTSRLQQAASTLLHCSPKETMSICQKLYESGYITYMRTDSSQYSDVFIAQCAAYIERIYGPSYVADSGLNSCSAQEAHEAIRPTVISLESLPDTFESKEKRMYALIRTNTLESRMPSARVSTIRATITAPKQLEYRYSAECVEFPGWKIVQRKHESDSKPSYYSYLQNIQPNTCLSYKKIIAKESLHGNVSHYTEATLVHLLEKHGIGRPSTFASLVDKIQERGYVTKENVAGKEYVCFDVELEDNVIREIETKREFGKELNKLVIQPLGVIVIEFLEKHFHSLFDYDYTKHMEESLDRIAAGAQHWVEVCASCNREIDMLLEQIKHCTKYEYPLDETHIFMIGKYGPVIKQVEEKNGKQEITFQPVQSQIDISKLEKGEYKLDDLLAPPQQRMGEYEGKELYVRKGKYGMYASWGENSKHLKDLGHTDVGRVTLEEVLCILEKEKDKDSKIIRVLTPDISIRKGPRGNYLFYKTAKMKKPKFYDIQSFERDTLENYETCDAAILHRWLKDTYQLK